MRSRLVQGSSTRAAPSGLANVLPNNRNSSTMHRNVKVGAKKVTLVNVSTSKEQVFDQPTIVLGSKKGLDVQVENAEEKHV